MNSLLSLLKPRKKAEGYKDVVVMISFSTAYQDKSLLIRHEGEIPEFLIQTVEERAFDLWKLGEGIYSEHFNGFPLEIEKNIWKRTSERSRDRFGLKGEQAINYENHLVVIRPRWETTEIDAETKDTNTDNRHL